MEYRLELYARKEGKTAAELAREAGLTFWQETSEPFFAFVAVDAESRKEALAEVKARMQAVGPFPLGFRVRPR